MVLDEVLELTSPYVFSSSAEDHSGRRRSQCLSALSESDVGEDRHEPEQSGMSTNEHRAADDVL